MLGTADCRCARAANPSKRSRLWGKASTRAFPALCCYKRSLRKIWGLLAGLLPFAQASTLKPATMLGRGPLGALAVVLALLQVRLRPPAGVSPSARGLGAGQAAAGARRCRSLQQMLSSHARTPQHLGAACTVRKHDLTPAATAAAAVLPASSNSGPAPQPAQNAHCPCPNCLGTDWGRRCDRGGGAAGPLDLCWGLALGAQASVWARRAPRARLAAHPCSRLGLHELV